MYEYMHVHVRTYVICMYIYMYVQWYYTCVHIHTLYVYNV